MKTVMKVETTRQVVGTLDEMFVQFGPLQETTEQATIRESFSGKSAPDGELRIVAADTGRILFFNSRELLTRFATMPTLHQKYFLECVRNAMKGMTPKVMESVICLTIPWSNSNARKILIRWINQEGDLNIHLI